jgi:hypothetical protein
MTSKASAFAKLAAAASVALTGAALAHPHESGDGEKVHKVIVLSPRDGSKAADREVREFRMLRREKGGFSWPNGADTKIDEATGGDRTKILICSDDKLSSAERAKKLEDVLARLQSEDHFSAEHKAKVEGALQEAIARLRATN